MIYLRQHAAPPADSGKGNAGCCKIEELRGARGGTELATNGTRMTRIGRIFADLIRRYLPDPHDPRSIVIRLNKYSSFRSCRANLRHLLARAEKS